MMFNDFTITIPGWLLTTAFYSLAGAGTMLLAAVVSSWFIPPYSR